MPGYGINLCGGVRRNILDLTNVIEHTLINTLDGSLYPYWSMNTYILSDVIKGIQGGAKYVITGIIQFQYLMTMGMRYLNSMGDPLRPLKEDGMEMEYYGFNTISPLDTSDVITMAPVGAVGFQFELRTHGNMVDYSGTKVYRI